MAPRWRLPSVEAGFGPLVDLAVPSSALILESPVFSVHCWMHQNIIIFFTKKRPDRVSNSNSEVCRGWSMAKNVRPVSQSHQVQRCEEAYMERVDQRAANLRLCSGATLWWSDTWRTGPHWSFTDFTDVSYRTCFVSCDRIFPLINNFGTTLSHLSSGSAEERGCWNNRTGRGLCF